MLNGKVVVITGGAGLLGQALCRAVSDQGALVIVADNNLNGSEKLAQQIVNKGGNAEAKEIDITDSASVCALIESIHNSHGKINSVVNNAYPRNQNYGRKLEDVEYGDFCENVSIHLGGYFLVAQKFSQYFKTQGGGNIVNMGSIYGSTAPRFDIYADTQMTMPVEYAAIKAAISHISRYLAQYYKKDNIRVNTLSPGGIFDNQPESFIQKYNKFAGKKGMLDREDIAGSLIYLLSDASVYMTGQDIIVDDGFSL